MNSGWPTRFIGIIEQLAKNHTLYIYAPGDTSLLAKQFPNCNIGASTSATPLPQKLNYGNYFKSLLTPHRHKLYLQTYEFYPEFYEQLKNVKIQFDRHFLFGLSAFLCYGHLYDPQKTITDFCDSLERHFRGSLNKKLSLKSRVVVNFDILYLYRIKRKFIPSNAHVIAITELDRNYIQRALPKNKVSVVPNGVPILKKSIDEKYIHNKWESRVCLFCGSLNYGPNIDSLTYVLKNVWPNVIEKCPDYSFHIVGRSPNENLKQLVSTSKNVKIFADVPDVFFHYEHAKLLLAPMFSGGGIKNKILEALSTATPVVANEDSFVGVNLDHKEYPFIEETKEQLINATINLINLPWEKYKEIAGVCHRVGMGYSWDSIGDQLESLLQNHVPILENKC